MSNPKLCISIIFSFLCCNYVVAQTDSPLLSVQQIPDKYISRASDKIDKYSSRLTSKTEKTLIKLSRWENKIHALLQKVNPETANRLFANKDMTFAGLLEKLQQGQNITNGYKVQYNEYRDKLTTGIKYIQEEKVKSDSGYLKKARSINKKTTDLEEDVAISEVVENFIRERKKQLVSESFKYLGRSKYLSKINKESYYYVETLKNYKEIFSDPAKTEETAKTILSKIPAFEKFMQQNSMLGSLFGSPASYGTPQSMAGLQTRAGVNTLIQNQLSTGGPNAQQMMKDQMQLAQAELAKLKNKLLSNIPSNGEGELPDFKPNEKKSKTFKQRLDYGANLEFAKATGLLPGTTNIGLSIGYKINDKSTAGIGMGYKLGMGTIQHIRFSHQGISLRSYLDWQLKKNIFISGGFELNHNTAFTKIEQLKDKSAWQQSGLIGLMKKLPLKTKMVKNTKVQLLYDILYRTHIPVSQPVVFRVGYGF